MGSIGQTTRRSRRVDVGLELMAEPVTQEVPSYWARAVPAERFARLAQDMHHAIVAHAGSPDADDALLALVISESVEAFFSRAGHPVAAALKVATVMRRIGAREAAIGRSFDVFDTSLRIARGACEAHLPRVLALHPLPEHRVQELRDDLAIYIDQLREHARVGYDRQWSLEEISPEHAELALRRTLFDDKAVPDPERLKILAEHAGRTLPMRLQPLVALDARLPREVLRAEDALSGVSPHEAFLAGDVGPDRTQRIAAGLAPGGLLVVGEAADPHSAHRALTVARRAASMVASGLLPRTGKILRCQDVLGCIATAADPYLLDLLVSKHLAGFDRMSSQRRVDMGELLLEWLETGDPVNEIARRTGQHTQTLHSRMHALRRVLGDVLGDGQQRVELILALRRELPTWQRRVRAS